VRWDRKVGELLTSPEDDALEAAIRNLGGHDLQAIGEAFAAIDDTRPAVIFAYTVKGYGLATEGHPQNHSSLLTAEQMASLAARSGMSLDSPWRRFDPASPQARCAPLRRDGSPATPGRATTSHRSRRTSDAPRAGRPPRRPRWGAPCST
jgi:pyruvate dehydrogenase E1 component